MKNKTYALAVVLLLGSQADFASAELFLHFKFDEPIGSGAFGEIVHNSAGPVNGEIRGNTSQGLPGEPVTGGWLEGVPGFGNAYNFNATDTVDVPLAALDALDQAGANPTKVTVAYWKKGNNLPNDDTYPYNEDFMVSGMWLHSWSYWNGFVGTGAVNQGANAGTDFTDQTAGVPDGDSLNEWHHYAFTKDAELGEMVQYIDGNLVASVVGYTKQFGAPNKFNVGSHVFGQNSFGGALDDFRMYNHVLDGDEIFDLMTPPGPGLVGDYNEDGKVDAADYTKWRNNLGAPAGTLPNDIDGGVIGTAQYDTWVANFGSTLGAGDAAAVPEPGTLAIALGLLLVGGGCRRRGLSSLLNNSVLRKC